MVSDSELSERMNELRNKMAVYKGHETDADILTKYPLVQNYMNKWNSRLGSVISKTKFKQKSPTIPTTDLAAKTVAAKTIAASNQSHVSKCTTNQSCASKQPSTNELKVSLPTDASTWKAVAGNPVSLER